jgi:hypothetical protein
VIEFLCGLLMKVELGVLRVTLGTPDCIDDVEDEAGSRAAGAGGGLAIGGGLS